MKSLQSRGASRRAFGLALASVGLLIPGCASYEPSPFDPDLHTNSFLSRSPGDEPITALAARLNESSKSPADFDASDGLTLQEAEVLALIFNSDLRQARHRAGVTLATAEHAGLWQDPVLGVDLTRILADVTNQWKIGIPIGLTIPLSGRLEAEKDQARAAHRAELTRLESAEWTTRMAVRRAFIIWACARLRTEILEEFLSDLQSIVSIVDRMEQSGEMVRIEARLFRIELATRAAELDRLRAQVSQSDLAIKRLVGLPPAADPQWVGASFAPVTQSSLHDARNRALHTSPALAIARAEYELAERTLATEIRSQYPDLQIGPGYGREDGNDELLLGFQFPIPLWNRNQKGVAEALAARALARTTWEAAIESLLHDLESAHLQHQAALTQRTNFESRIVPLVDQQVAEARRVSELGEVNTIILMDSLTRRQEAKLHLINSYEHEWLAVIALDELTGPATPEQSAPSLEIAP